VQLQVESKSGVPIYIQLKNQIKYLIAAGKLAAGEQLPTVRQLAVDLTINPNTVARIYAELEREGLLRTQQGRGTFVAAPPEPALLDEERRRRLRETLREALIESTGLGFSLEEIREELLAILSQWEGNRNG
jgi:GntR family transcriptional regulator